MLVTAKLYLTSLSIRSNLASTLQTHPYPHLPYLGAALQLNLNVKNWQNDKTRKDGRFRRFVPSVPVFLPGALWPWLWAEADWPKKNPRTEVRGCVLANSAFRAAAYRRLLAMADLATHAAFFPSHLPPARAATSTAHANPPGHILKRPYRPNGEVAYYRESNPTDKKSRHPCQPRHVSTIMQASHPLP